MRCLDFFRRIKNIIGKSFIQGLDVSPHLEHDLEGMNLMKMESHDVAGAFDSGLGEDASLTDELDKALESAEVVQN